MSGTEHVGLSVIEQLAAYVTGEAFDRLPAATMVAARRAILDTLGVTLAGAVEPTAERVRTMLEHRRARQDATIVGTSLRGAVEDAALANGIASHALDYDEFPGRDRGCRGGVTGPVIRAAVSAPN
jgi:2-methylcitrate dehydratase PrpD